MVAPKTGGHKVASPASQILYNGGGMIRPQNKDRNR
jgi:hypothetical protein